jgi:hypothetical protein
LERDSTPSSRKKGALEALRKEPPADSVILDIDGMGPVAAKSYPGQEAIDGNARPAERAKQEIDYGRRAKGSVYGALWKTSGDFWTQCYPRRIKAHFIDFHGSRGRADRSFQRAHLCDHG